MGTEQYLKWKRQIKNFMEVQGESPDFICYVHDWFDEMKGKSEVQLLQDFHPSFKESSHDEIFEFIMKARYIPKDFKDEEFSYQNFNSAFLLYRPYLKLEFNHLQG